MASGWTAYGSLAPQDAVLYIVDILNMGVCLGPLLTPLGIADGSNNRVLPVEESHVRSPMDAYQLAS
jgi:hypothetical protein